MTLVNASNAMMKVLQDWGVKNVYGLPGGSFDSTMNALHDFRETIRYIGVRHEEVGALAAAAEAKLTGKIGVTFGSAGPGAVHLLNGLYDARHDHAPVLALIGQVATPLMNMDYFQELPENPIFADVAVYNRTVTTAEQLPDVIDTAIRHAYERRGVAVVVIPRDLGWTKITDGYISSANSYAQPEWTLGARIADVEKTLDLISAAARPIIYFGRGADGAAAELRELSELMQLPLMSTYLAKGILPDDYPGYMISTGRVSTKPGTDVGKSADLILFIGTNYEFGTAMFDPEASFIDVNLDATAIGARHATVLGIRADGPEFLRQLLAAARARECARENHAGWYLSALEDKRDWDSWIAAQSVDTRVPVRIPPVFAEINRIAAVDAVFGVDVGNINIETARFLHMTEQRTMTTSALYATMGYGLPASIAAALVYPERQVWSLSGDGGFAMVAQDLATQALYHLRIINIVLTNRSLGFIEGEQDDQGQPHSGVELMDIDFARVAEGFGVRGITARTIPELRSALAEALDATEPILIDVKVTDDRLLPTEIYPLRRGDRPDFDEFVARYEASALRPFAETLADHGVVIS
ncbi:pyruvate oxidase [Humibacillus sp. DSM 29435]|uniref:pyruvate oxidase n=1 Tax=Humibacillus sp. DSM 29435 TaxID=1869167 RepID=UPI0008724987|nr:pyruvate oxidase [Humibacillus sp. DSM 29435]OFE18063.1 pyruvate oxidase [Humibacillus sp. DSM 29435]